MRLSLADLKKTLFRRNGVAYVVPYLLKAGELSRELGALIGLYEAWIGRPRATFPEDRPTELIGDYRLARCLTLCLAEWYTWQPAAWPGPASAAEAAALATRDLASPTDLRLALFDAVNASGAGYLASTEREAWLDAFAEDIGIRRATLDALLRLDAEAEAVLQRVAAQPPAPAALAARYAQRAVETLLTNAASVEWVIEPEMAEAAGNGLGTVVKRVCFLARTMGVQYDVAFAAPGPAEEPPRRAPAPEALRRVAEARAGYDIQAATTAAGERALPPDRALRITLFGPQELMGAPNQYGERLARLCRALLGYRRQAGSGAAAFAARNLRGVARVYLHGRPVLFALDARILHALEGADTAPDEAPSTRNDDAAATFDSALEQSLAEEFAALERAGEAHGWRLEREPEPLLAGGVILVPDFALTREAQRIYLEIAGYWRPEYRERKLRKLNALRGRVNLMLAVPESARAEFASLEDSFPTLWYQQGIRAQALLQVLDRAYDDRERRLSRLELPRIARELAMRRRIPATESFALLHCYTRGELADALRRLEAEAHATGGAVPVWIDGIGLCSPSWREATLASLREIVATAPGGRMSLGQLQRRLAEALADLPDLDEVMTERLVEQAGLAVVRTSIFEAEARLPHTAAASPPPAEPGETQSVSVPARAVQPRKSVRRRHNRTTSAAQAAQSVQLSFAPECAGDAVTEPDPHTRATE